MGLPVQIDRGVLRGGALPSDWGVATAACGVRAFGFFSLGLACCQGGGCALVAEGLRAQILCCVCDYLWGDLACVEVAADFSARVLLDVHPEAALRFGFGQV